jgi:hypothetical protein
MPKITAIDVDDPLRITVGRFVRASFAPKSGIRPDVSPSRPLAIVDARDEIHRAGGLRAPDDVSEPPAFAIASPVFATDPGDRQGTGSVDA